jgi:asparagine synthase (glutamine-hydrolysing)
MFHIAAVVAWSSGREPLQAQRSFDRALIHAGGSGRQSEHLPGSVLGAVAYGARGGNARDQVRTDGDAQVAIAGIWRLDNRDEVARALRLGGSTDDALLLLEAYKRWGDSFPARVKGDFAGVIWDWGARRLLGFRDRLGVRPLFYAVRPDTIAVATDVELLLSIVGDGGSPDDQTVVEYLTWQFHSVDRTFWSGVRRLPAGHVLDASAAGPRVRQFWDAPQPAAVDPADVYPRFRDLFFQSVRRRLTADGPVLAHLSGGIDSSSIVCVADSLLRAETGRFPQVRTVSARYPGLDTDEGTYIDAVTRSVSIPAETWDGRSAEFIDLSSPSIAGPGFRSHRADGTTEEFTIAERLGAVAILSGQGGDQLGVPSGLSEHLVRVRPLWFGWRILSPDDLSWAERARRVKFLLRSLTPASFNQWRARHRGRQDAPGWLESRWRTIIGDIHADAARRSPRVFRSVVQEVHWRDLLGGAMALALDADHRIAARRGVEMRYPFLDQDLVDFVLQLPPERWPMPEPHARLQRTALADLLPEAVLARRGKAMFSPVVASYLKNAAPRLRSLLFEGPWAAERWVSRRDAQALFDRAMNATREGDWADWQAVRAIATLEAWLRGVFGYDARTQVLADRRKS